MEFKTIKTEFKAAGDGGRYEGHFSVFENLDEGADVMHAGAFAKTIAERATRVKVFYAHDWMKLIGPPPDALKEDVLGLFAAGRLTLDSFWGKEVNALMRDGALTEGSIGYEAVKFDYEQMAGNQEMRGMTIRHLREVKLYEISPVPLGMNPLTQVQAVKAALAARGQPGMGDETLLAYLAEQAQAMQVLGENIKAGRVLSAASREKVSNAAGALEAALEALKTLLEAADAGDGGKTVPHSALQKRLRAAELALAFVGQ